MQVISSKSDLMDKEKFEFLLRDFFSVRSAFTFAKGRVALYAALRALGLGPEDEVILPGYTCMVVPGAVKFLGCRPVYVDIEASSYNLNPTLLESAFSSRTRALIIQHTYGLPCYLNRILPWAVQKGISVIEDCCHAFGSRFRGQLLGTFAIASFYSGQWNKSFSTGMGGILVIPESTEAGKFAEEIERLTENEAYRPGWYRNLYLGAQILAHDLLVRPGTSLRITRLYRFLSRNGLMIGSSSNDEFRCRLPERYFSLMSPCQMEKGRREMDRIEDNIASRRQNAQFYQEHLADIGLHPLQLDSNIDPVFICYPVRVGNKSELLAMAERKGIELGSWFDSPLHPLQEGLELFDYHPGQCPVSEEVSREVINLPTHRRIGVTEREKILTFLQKNAVRP